MVQTPRFQLVWIKEVQQTSEQGCSAFIYCTGQLCHWRDGFKFKFIIFLLWKNKNMLPTREYSLLNCILKLVSFSVGYKLMLTSIKQHARLRKTDNKSVWMVYIRINQDSKLIAFKRMQRKQPILRWLHTIIVSCYTHLRQISLKQLGMKQKNVKSDSLSRIHYNPETKTKTLKKLWSNVLVIRVKLKWLNSTCAMYLKLNIFTFL